MVHAQPIPGRDDNNDKDTTKDEVQKATVEPVEVNIKDDTFNPSTVEVQVGQTVRWTNHERKHHHVLGNTIDSGVLRQNDTYEQTFHEVGEHDYHCDRVPEMVGKVVVK